MAGVITAKQYRHVADLIADVTRAEILPRFRALSDSDITHKRPGDLVTTADRLTEQRLSPLLEEFLPGSVAIGEESVEHDRSLLCHTHTNAPVWIIDPVDGTSNFVAGSPDYSCLVTLSTKDEIHASWIDAPSLGLTAGAHDGQAWINDEAVRVTPPQSQRLDTVVTSHPNYAGTRSTVIDKLHAEGIATVPCNSAGLSYVDLLHGEYDALVYSWEKPWDHAAGLHLYTTAGGTAMTMTSEPFRVSGGNSLPFIVGTGPVVDRLHSILT